MERFDYKNITEAEAEKLEKVLLKKLAWLRTDLPTRWDRLMYEETTDRLNNAWKKSSFWRLPDYFQLIEFTRENYPEYFGTYNLPVNVLASEPFYIYLESKLYLDEIEKMKGNNFDSSRQKLEAKKNEITSEINRLQVEFFREVLHVADQMQEVIQENSHDSIEYDPFLLSLNGEITHQRIELIGKAEDTYRGVICGSQFATDYLLRDFIFVNHEIIDVLKDLSEQLLQASKTFLAVQMIDEYFKSPAGVKEKKVSDKALLIEIQKCIDIEIVELRDKEIQFLTKERKVKPTTIGAYLHERYYIDIYEDDRQLKKRVNELMGKCDGVVEREKGYFKK